ncbi:MAG TPA: malectin domain-containing carbohydrate-binding protein [Burkholderiaceae bacterium]|nr:malectin domain-containing carbohydrate-binding protein [Burkholderiaceae bacterium]
MGPVEQIVVGIPVGTSLPSNGIEGQLFFHSTEERLYRYRSGQWVLDTPAIVTAPAPALVQGTITPSPVPITAAINAGGGPIVLGAQSFAADQYFFGGNVITPVTTPIDGTPLDALYQTERWGEFSYVIPLQDGLYEVAIHQAEIFAGISGPNQRLFDIVLEPGETGEQWVRNIDIWSAVGPNAAFDIVRTVAVTGGSLAIDFRRKVQEPRVSAISVRPASGSIAEHKTVPALRAEVLAALEGIANVSCYGRSDNPLTFQVAETHIRLGGSFFPLSALSEMTLQSANYEGPYGGLNVALVLKHALGGTTTIRFSYSNEGSLTSVSLSEGSDGGFHCTSDSARWGSFDGDRRRLLERIPVLAQNYRAVRLMCRYSSAPDGIDFWNPYRGVFLVEFIDSQLRFTDHATPKVIHTVLGSPRFHALPGQRDYPYRQVTLREDDLIQYGVWFSIPGDFGSITVDSSGVIRGANSPAVKLGQPQVSCPIPALLAIGSARQPSGNGSAITEVSGGSLVDNDLAVWTLANGVVQINGQNAGYSANVVLLLWHNGSIYQRNAEGGWWRWNGATWEGLGPQGDPRTS